MQKKVVLVLGTSRPLGGATHLSLTADPQPLSCGRTRYLLTWSAHPTPLKPIPVMMTTESARQKARPKVLVSRTSDGELPSDSNELLFNNEAPAARTLEDRSEPRRPKARVTAKDTEDRVLAQTRKAHARLP